MKSIIGSSIKQILADRLLTAMLVVFVLLCVFYCIYVGVSLHPSELQVAVHYTAFGETNFYRARWYYLLTFIGFGVVLAVMHTILAAKILLQGRRQLALFFACLSILLVLVTWLITRSILAIAFPA